MIFEEIRDFEILLIFGENGLITTGPNQDLDQIIEIEL